jgi:hypothetical protein
MSYLKKEIPWARRRFIEKESDRLYRLSMLRHEICFFATWFGWRRAAVQLFVYPSMLLTQLIVIPALALWRLVRRGK